MQATYVTFQSMKKYIKYWTKETFHMTIQKSGLD